MMKKQIRVASILVIVLLMISVSVNVVLALDSAQAEPGSDQDPLVSKSYVDTAAAKNEAIISQLKSEIEELKKKLSETGTSGSEGFKVVELEAGSTILAGSGTEILLRSGKATAKKGQNGDALADATGAKDLVAGAAVPANHLLISSRDDGRGMKAAIKCYLLVRGPYNVEKAAAGSTTTPSQENTGDTSGGNTGNNTGGSSDNNGSQTSVKTATVNASSLNIRTGPGTENKLAGSAVKGEKVTVLEQSGEWSRIKNAKGVEGWVLSKFLTIQ